MGNHKPPEKPTIKELKLDHAAFLSRFKERNIPHLMLCAEENLIVCYNNCITICYLINAFSTGDYENMLNFRIELLELCRKHELNNIQFGIIMIQWILESIGQSKELSKLQERKMPYHG